MRGIASVFIALGRGTGQLVVLGKIIFAIRIVFPRLDLIIQVVLPFGRNFVLPNRNLVSGGPR